MNNNFKDLLKNKNLQAFVSEKNQKFFGLVLTLCALSFFGFFAIKPTVSTIIRLQKEISDSQLILNKLGIKINNLTELRKQYFNLQDDIPIVTSAITVQSDVPLLFGQIQSIGLTSNVTIKKLQNFEVEVLGNDNKTGQNYSSYSFAVGGEGSLENISGFMDKLINMERVVNIDMFSINKTSNQKDGSIEFDIQGTAFFKDNL